MTTDQPTTEQVRQIPNDDQRTRAMVEKLLKMNTGRHLLDSGGAYGRHFERNQQIDDMDTVPTVKYSLSSYDVDKDGDELEIYPSFSIYHWAISMLSYSDRAAQIDQHFQRWADQRDGRNSWLNDMETFSGNKAMNTYNHEFGLAILDQVIQFCPVALEGPIAYTDERDPQPADGEVVVDDAIYELVETRDVYDTDLILIQFHNSCDMRGGYTRPVVFEVEDPDHLYMQPTVTAACDVCGAQWNYREGRFRPLGRNEHEAGPNDYGTPSDWSVVESPEHETRVIIHDHEMRHPDDPQQALDGDGPRRSCAGRITIDGSASW